MPQAAAGWWRTAVVSQVGGKVNEGRCRLQYTSALDEQAEPDGAKEWRMLAELRPAPPPPPKDWLAAVRTNEVLELARPDGWLTVFVEEKLLPVAEGEAPRFFVQGMKSELAMQVESSQLRPPVVLEDGQEGVKQWASAPRRAGPRAAALLTLRHDGKTTQLVEQVAIAGAQPVHAAEGAPPTPIDEAVAAAAGEEQLFTVLLRQEDGAWSFGGDGSTGFVSPLAPLPKDEHMTRYAAGDAVEISPTDEGYVGSWYEGKVIATSGGKPGQLHLEYSTLEESEGVPLREWQPRTIVRPKPPPFSAGSFPQARASASASRYSFGTTTAGGSA